MFQALVITLREGVEAALILAITAGILERRGDRALRRWVFLGAATALVASAGLALALARIDYNQELAEGIAMLAGALLVFGLVWWMWRAAPRMHEEIAHGLDRAASKPGAAAGLGVFLFGFGMVLREGVETALFLSAAAFNTQGLALWLGALIGAVLAVAFGVLFVRGALRVRLSTFFGLTSAVLVMLGIQLLVGGLHELSEAQVLPASRTEMAVIGPVVKNELLMFTITIALAAGWLLAGARAGAAPVPAAAEGPEARLARAARARDERSRRTLAGVGLAIVALLATAFVQQSRIPGRAPATPVVVQGDDLAFDAAPLSDGRMHFYEAPLPAGAVRFFAVQVGDEVKTCLDACEICGDIGYFEDGAAVVCRNCTSPIVRTSLGRTGGCNPIPVPHRREGASLVIAADDLERAQARIRH